MTLIATIINKAAVGGNARRHHAPFDMGVRLTDDHGGVGYSLILTGQTDSILAAYAPTVSSIPEGLTWDPATGELSGIEIPLDSKTMEVWFIVQENQDLRGEHTNILYTATPYDSVPAAGTPDTVTTNYAADYRPGGMNLNHIMQGAGKVYYDGIPMGFFTRDGVTETITLEDGSVLVDQMSGELAKFPNNCKVEVKFTPNQITLEMMTIAQRNTATITTSDTIPFEGALRSGLTQEFIPEEGFLDTHVLELVGTSSRFDGQTIRKIYHRAVKTGATEQAMKNTDTIQGIPMTFSILQDPISKSFFKTEFIF